MQQDLQPQDVPAPFAGLHPLEVQRRENREAIAALGIEPYGGREPGLMSLAQAFEAYDEAADAAYQAAEEAVKADPAAPPPASVDGRPVVRVAGRVVLKRGQGKLIWLNLRDASRETFQIALSKAECDERSFRAAELLDLGDVVVVEGPVGRTRKGEVTCWARELRLGAKSLTPPPEKRLGLVDVELRYRQRYVDLWATPEAMRVFRLRSLVVSEIRRWLGERGFEEVETPMLQPQAGGAAARPFVTHMNALDMDLFMRVAPELYLKRLLVGGMPRVFEINRNFRNEGLDKQHNPEFTMLELYEAFGDCASVMALTESLVRHAATVAAAARASAGEGPEQGVWVAGCAELPEGCEGPVLRFADRPVDYGRAFDRVSYAELFECVLGFGYEDADRVLAAAPGHGCRLRDDKGAALDPLIVANELFEDVAEKSIDPGRPTFITDYPASLSPLTRPSRSNPRVAERADLFIGHMEVGPHYTELNDPDVQESKFREQLSGLDDEESTFRTFDEDFVRALKVGMPPAGGLGLGIDRLMMLLADQRTIRDVMLFPMMRAER